MTLFRIAHNWEDPFTVTQEVQIEILKRDAGWEQRIATRSRPRRGYDFNVLAKGRDARRLRARLINGHSEMHTFADPVRRTPLAVNVSAGADSLVLTETADWLALGRSVVLGTGEEAEEFTVAGYTGTNVQLNAPTNFEHRKGEHLHAGIRGWLPQSLRLSAVTDDLVTGIISVAEDVRSEPWVAPPAATVVWEGREVFMRSPNWSSPLELEFNQERGIVDFGYGIMVNEVKEIFPKDVTRYEFISATREEYAAIEDMFLRLCGPQGEFYMPTWQDDLELMSPVAAGNNFLIVERSVYDDFRLSLIHRAVCIFRKSGPPVFAKITGFIDLGNACRLTLADPIGANLTPQNVERISWLPVCRLTANSLVTEWLTNGVASNTLAVQALPALPPEV